MRKFKGHMFSIGAAMSWTISPIFIKESTTILPSPIFTSFISTILGTLVYSLLLLITGNWESPNLKKDKSKKNLFIISGFLSALGILCNFSALRETPVSIVVPLTSTTPLFTLVLSPIFLKGHEKVTLRVLLASILIVIGIILITK